MCLGSACNQNALKRQNAILLQRLDSLETEVQHLRSIHASYAEESGEELDVGFEVQIGAFREFDLGQYADELVRLRGTNEYGLNKYVLGRFHRFEDAERFLNDVRKMGVKDAFIAGVVNGQRTTVAEAKAAAKNYYGSEF